MISSAPPSSTESTAMPVDHAHTTLRWDRLRALATGPFNATAATFALIVTVQHFHASAGAKALLASGGSLGYLLTPLLLTLVAWLGLSAARAYSVLLAISAAAVAVAGLLPWFPPFCVGLLLASALCSAAAPLIAMYWRQNVAEATRGHWFSRMTRVEVIGNVSVTVLTALWIGAHPERYRPVLLLVAVALAVAAWAVARIPGQPLVAAAGHPLRALRWLWLDPRFGRITASTMVMGFANFAALPLRVEWLGKAEYGFSYRPDVLLLLLVIVPGVVRYAALPLWGRLFDRMDFLCLRMFINACFIGAMLAMFAPWWPAQVLGSILFGVGFAGGDISWNLWVTKIAPPEHADEYMSVHVFLTGVRGLLAPFVAFHLALATTPQVVGFSCAGLVMLASLMLLGERRPAQALP